MSRQLATETWPVEEAVDHSSREPLLVAVPEFAAPSRAPLSLEGRAPVSLWAREAVQRRLLAAGDALAVVVSLLAVGVGLHGVVRPGAAAAVALLGGVLVLVVFKLAGLYSRDELHIGHSTLDETPLLLQLTALLTVVESLLLAVAGGQGLVGVRIGLLFAAMLAAVFAARVGARALGRRLLGVERCLVVAQAAQSERVREKLAAARARAEVVACLPLEDDALEVLADPEVISALVDELQVHRIIVGADRLDGAELRELIRIARALSVRVSALQPMFGVLGSAIAFEQLEGMALLGVARFGLPRSSRMLKRALDLAGSALVLIVLAPLVAAIAAAIKLDSSGPVFFRQVRVGRRGRHFSIVKFRSMVSDADARKDELRPLSIAGDGLFKLRDDPRVTRVGRLLRASSLDELPQLFNVLRGEMSLVGPRPLVVDEDAQVVGLDRSRLRLTPGMTGPWQLLNERVPLQEMAEIDYLYATNWSLWLDLKIMLRTVGHMLRRGNV